MSEVSLIIWRGHYRRAKQYLEGYQVQDYRVESLEDNSVRLMIGRRHTANVIASLRPVPRRWSGKEFPEALKVGAKSDW